MAVRRRLLIWPFVVVAFMVTIYLTKIHQEMVDFDVYRTAASRALHGENLYRPTDGHYQYKYLPAFAFAMAPFAALEFRVARLIWYALSAGILVLFIRWSVRAVPEQRLTERVLVWAAILLVGKYYARDLNLGQTNLLLGAILVGALLAAEAGLSRTAGVLVAIGVFVKPYALILVPWVWLVAGLPALVSGAAALAVGLLLPALVYGWDGNLGQILGWYRTVTDTTPENLLVPENVSFATMWAKWIGVGALASWLAIATSALALGLAGLIVSKRRGVREPAYLEFGALMLLVPLLSPQGWDYVLLLATPAILVIVDRWRDASIPWRAFTALALFVFSFTIFDLFGRTLYTFLTGINIVSLASLALMVCLVHLRWRKLA
jgi:hypothetical protein